MFCCMCGCRVVCGLYRELYVRGWGTKLGQPITLPPSSSLSPLISPPSLPPRYIAYIRAQFGPTHLNTFLARLAAEMRAHNITPSTFAGLGLGDRPLTRLHFKAFLRMLRTVTRRFHHHLDPTGVWVETGVAADPAQVEKWKPLGVGNRPNMREKSWSQPTYNYDMIRIGRMGPDKISWRMGPEESFASCVQNHTGGMDKEEVSWGG